MVSVLLSRKQQQQQQEAAVLQLNATYACICCVSLAFLLLQSMISCVSVLVSLVQSCLAGLDQSNACSLQSEVGCVEWHGADAGLVQHLREQWGCIAVPDTPERLLSTAMHLHFSLTVLHKSPHQHRVAPPNKPHIVFDHTPSNCLCAVLQTCWVSMRSTSRACWAMTRCCQ
jgi:hypothetical protein